MTSAQKMSRVFYGCGSFLASGIGLALHFGPIIVGTFGVFLKPCCRRYKLTRV